MAPRAFVQAESNLVPGLSATLPTTLPLSLPVPPFSLSPTARIYAYVCHVQVVGTQSVVANVLRDARIVQSHAASWQVKMDSASKALVRLSLSLSLSLCLYQLRQHILSWL